MTAGQPRDVEPQLASSGQPLGPGPWIYERKLDGVRLLVHVRDGAVRLQSRHHTSYTENFPELVTHLAATAGDDLIADGEVVAFDGEDTSFSRLQQRLGAPGTAATRQRVPVELFLFDLLHLAGHDLRGRPQRERRNLLEVAFTWQPPVHLTAEEHGDPDQLLQEACARGWEGLIAKDPRAPYRAGRSTAWRKLPCLRTAPLVVASLTRPQGAREGFGALLVGYHDGGRLRYAGKVGTGFDTAQLATIADFLSRLEVPSPPFEDPPSERGVRWVEPVVVIDVAFRELTPAGRLRHPRFVGVATHPPAKAVGPP